MKIVIDDKSGFCFGVVRAVKRAELELLKGDLFSLGHIVHNKVEVARLERKGLKVIANADLDTMSHKRVYIRAHGEPPTTFQNCLKNNIEIIDATCPVVYKLQQKVIKAMELMKTQNGQVVIIGKKGHPEVIGLNGQIDNQGLVIEKLEDIDKIDFDRPIYILSQTTKSLRFFEQVSSEVTKRFKLDRSKLIIKDTICRSVSDREDHLTKFSSEHDLIIFVSGKDSSNGMVLYEVCRSSNSNCYKIEDEKELDNSWFDGVDSVGICGATSTPKWLLEQVASHIETHCV